MTTFEWLSMIGVALGGFWSLTEKLSRINATLATLVTHQQCAERRHNCPAMKNQRERRKRG